MFKVDSSGEHDLVSVSDFEGLVGELEVQSKTLNRKKSVSYVQLTMSQFDNIREEIYSSYSQAGCMDEIAAKSAEKAYNSVLTAERANLLSTLRI